ncbi:HEAT repeat domain-containing protein, partial [Myxococcota bacterium]|nr:HEAT repeat domain-containing protein [Myxococcota bacterium]
MAPAKSRALPFRGELQALIGHKATLIFTTKHPEGQATALYRYDADADALTAHPLPSGGGPLIADEARVYIGGLEGQLYASPLAGGAPSPLGEALDGAPLALGLLSEDRLAVLLEAEVLILNRHSGALLQRLPLSERASALAAHGDGIVFAVGGRKGEVTIFDCEGKAAFLQGESAKLHGGPVRLMAFEPDDLRLLTSGDDGQFLSVYARGPLEAEARAGKSGHTGAVVALTWDAEADLFYTLGEDKEIKTWARESRRSSGLKRGVVAGVALARVEVKGQPRLALATADARLRLFPLDDDLKPGDHVLTLADAYAYATAELAAEEVSRREAALDALAGYRDARAVALLAAQAEADGDNRLRVKATAILGASGHRQAAPHLKRLLSGRTQGVRFAALDGLRALEGQDQLEPLYNALDTHVADVGVRALSAIAERAAQDDQAMERLLSTVNDQTKEIRLHALSCLESLHDAADPNPSLIALKSRYADLRYQAALRLHQRGLLGHEAARRALRRLMDDGEGRVRDAAFLLNLLSAPPLAAALRTLDADLHRRLYALEMEGVEPEAEEAEAAAEDSQKPAKKKGKKKGKGGDEEDVAEIPKPKKASLKLSDEDKRPLFEGMASRTLDTCVAAATALAALGDGRAFGALLQLSRGRAAETRVNAARALQALNDPRALQRLRLMLRDDEARVRDAAFSALATLLSGAPLEAVEAGLSAPFEDVRSRALEILIQRLKKQPPKGDADPAQRLLERALNDGAAVIRDEALRVVLRLKINGGDAQTLRFALRSLHVALRRQALTEIMGEIKHDWAWDLLLTMLNDPAAELRAEALDFAQKKGKGRGLAPLEAALKSDYMDTRLEGIKALGKKKHGAKAEPPLVAALDDPERDVRRAALEALEGLAAKEALIAAMDSPHEDVRVRAASGRAALGDARALPVLMAQIQTEAPEIPALRAIWKGHTLSALAGLTALSAPQAVEALSAQVMDSDAEIRRAAAEALAWSVTEAEPLTRLLHADDAEVKISAALGLARLGDPSGAALIFPGEQLMRGARLAAPQAAFAAALTLGNDDLLEAHLDDSDAATRMQALRLLLLMEWVAPEGAPRRCLAALSAADPWVRLPAAEAAERFNDPAGLGEVVLRLLRQRGARQAEGITPAHAEALALSLAYGPGPMRARAAQLLAHLNDLKGLLFRAAFDRFAALYAVALEQLKAEAAARKPTPSTYSEAEITALIFGAYVGLSSQGGYSEAPIRLTAIQRLQALAERGAAPLEAVTPVLIQALSDPHAQVRMGAFDALEALKVAPARRAAEALATGLRDVGVRGLEVLSTQAGEGSDEVLKGVMLTYTDGLEHEATALLVKAVGGVVAWRAALESQSPGLRDRAVQELSALYQAEPEATAAALGVALSSRAPRVRLQAAIALAEHKHPSAFEPLTRAHLAAEDSYTQRQAISALERLGDPRAADALIDRAVHDPSGAADVQALLTAAAHFQDKAIQARLTSLLEARRLADAAHSALKILCGYDQDLELSDDDPQQPEWLKAQRPRDDEGLAALLDRALELNKPNWIRPLLTGAAWSRSPAVDGVLARCAGLADDATRRQAVERYGWRLKRRGADKQPLTALLEHTDPETSFYAAEGLALAGHKEGLSVLLSSVELLTNFELRRRAVAALGLTADPRALDVLLRLADEEGHALQDEAAEALGHLSQLEEAPQVFTRLERLAKRPWSVGLRALRGLRHFNTPAAWRLIRARLDDESWQTRQLVAELMAEDPDTSAKALLSARLLKEHDWDVLRALGEALRRQWGAESLEPDYLFLQIDNQALSAQMTQEETLARVGERGDPARLFEILHLILRADLRQPVIAALLNRQPTPVAAALAALTGDLDARGAIAAHVLGRASALEAEAKAALASTLEATLDRYAALRAKQEAGRSVEAEPAEVAARLARLIWAAARHGVADEAILRAARWEEGRADAREIRSAALHALGMGAGG